MSRKAFSIFVILSFLAGCATLGLTPWAERTPKEKAIAFMQFYNSEYQDTFRMATDPKSTPAQKEVAMAKKKILAKLYPLIQGYDAIVVEGRIPPLDMEQQILGLINKLGGAL
jgi:hypothetical protein